MIRFYAMLLTTGYAHFKVIRLLAWSQRSVGWKGSLCEWIIWVCPYWGEFPLHRGCTLMVTNSLSVIACGSCNWCNLVTTLYRNSTLVSLYQSITRAKTRPVFSNWCHSHKFPIASQQFLYKMSQANMMDWSPSAWLQTMTVWIHWILNGQCSLLFLFLWSFNTHLTCFSLTPCTVRSWNIDFKRG